MEVFRVILLFFSVGILDKEFEKYPNDNDLKFIAGVILFNIFSILWESRRNDAN